VGLVQDQRHAIRESLSLYNQILNFEDIVELCYKVTTVLSLLCGGGKGPWLYDSEACQPLLI
jgi:hypothetical protein